MSFRTQFESHSRVVQPAGDRSHTLYSGRYTDTGHFILEESGKEDIYDKIQSHASSVDIHVILDRFRRGDIEALGDASRSIYFDTSEMPKNYAHLLNIVNEGEQAFMSMPVEERAKYGHSFVQWMMSFDKSSADTVSSDTVSADKVSADKEVSTSE